MSKTSEKTCPCKKTSCGCRESAEKRCSCGDDCRCAAGCPCGDSCACSTTH